MAMADPRNLVVPHHVALQSAMDLSDLSSDQRAMLIVSVGQFRLARERIATDILIMTQQLSLMSEILKTRFMQFATVELGLNERTARRYLKMHKVLSAHFSDADGRINAGYANQLTQSALTLLSPETDTDVIDEIKTLVKDGQKVDEDTVRQLIASREKDLEAEVAATKAEAESLTRKLVKVSERSELEISRVRRQMEGLEEQVRRLEAQASAANEEVDRLQKDAIQVNTVEKPVEVLPKEYASALEAVNAAKAELTSAVETKKRVDDELAAAKQQLDDFNISIRQTRDGMEQFKRLKEHVDAIALHFPAALVKSVTSADSTIKAAIADLGETLVAMGKQLQGA